MNGDGECGRGVHKGAHKVVGVGCKSAHQSLTGTLKRSPESMSAEAGGKGGSIYRRHNARGSWRGGGSQCTHAPKEGR